MEITEDDIGRMKGYLGAISGPRREWGKLRHKPVDMLVIALCAVIIGEDEFEALEMEWLLRKFWNCPKGYRTRTHSGACLNGWIRKRRLIA